MVTLSTTVVLCAVAIVAGAAWESFYAFDRLATFFGWPSSHSWSIMPLVELFLIVGSAELALRVIFGASQWWPRLMTYSALVVSLAVNITFHVLTLLYPVDEAGKIIKGAKMIEVETWQPWVLGALAALIPLAQLGAVHTLATRLQLIATNRRRPASTPASAPAGPSLLGLGRQIAAGYLVRAIPPAPAPAHQGGAPAPAAVVPAPAHQGGAPDEVVRDEVVREPETHQGGAPDVAHQGGAPELVRVEEAHQGGAPELDAPAHQGGAPDETHQGGALDEVVRDEVVRDIADVVRDLGPVVRLPRFAPGAPVPVTTLPAPLSSIIGTTPAPPVDDPEVEPEPIAEPQPVDPEPPVDEPEVPAAAADPVVPPADEKSDQADSDPAPPTPISRGADKFRATLGKVAASEIAAPFGSWAELLDAIADQTNTAVTLRRLEAAIGIGRKAISNALEHTDLLDWPTRTDDRKEATA